MQKGKLTCVGPGMTLGAHMSVRCKNQIENADVVFVSCHPLMEEWIGTMNADVRSLQGLYAEGKDRRTTYAEMEALILEQVRKGKNVVGAFYGHPGVFALVPHRAVSTARKEGYIATMEPGISAEDCLYADLGIDPGRLGCQHFEASQFMFYKRNVDTGGYLILWQVGLAGDTSIAKRLSNEKERSVLVALLQTHYPANHEVILYECPTLICDAVRNERIQLQNLASAALTQVTTLVIPPAAPLVKNTNLLARLAEMNDA